MNRSTNNIPLILFITFLFFSCSNFDKRTDQEIESLIEKNKDSLLFLNFWSNMSDEDFKRVIMIENKKGNLTNGKYIFKVPSKNYAREYDDISFNLKNGEDYIWLKYENEYWIDKQSELHPSKDGVDKGKYYNSIINELIKHFDSKYERIKDFNEAYRGNLGWKIDNENDIVISMNDGVSFFDKNSMSYYRKTKGEKEQLASCYINLSFKTYSTYIKKKEDNLKEIQLKKEKEEQEKNSAKENNDIL
jgi:hypothetical protein